MNNMKERHSKIRTDIWLVILLLAISNLIGCTTMQSQMTVEVYTKNKSARNAVEQVAEEFCSKKRANLNVIKSVRQPDFIFTTDGCSRWPDDSWLGCCIVHDITYWCGGSAQDRKDADQELMQCVNSKNSPVGTIMYSGVRIAGVPWLPTPWRWGYGWDDWSKDYDKPSLTPTVKQLIRDLGIHKIVDKNIIERITNKNLEKSKQN
jgi:hypothetical protein